MIGDNDKFEPLEPRRLFSTIFTVSNTSDHDAGSLRDAITDANTTLAAQSATIVFDIPGTGVQTIKPLSQLPTITAQVDIEGTTDSSGNPLIELDGENAGDMAIGLFFNRNTSGNIKPSEVSGLIVNRFQLAGIGIAASSPTDVYGCRIGTDATGTKALGNDIGIEIDGSNNQIGTAGNGAEFQTIISGNNGDGIFLDGDNNIIQNCFIGTDITGNKALPNHQNGIDCTGSDNTIGGDRSGEGNVISGNLQDGIDMHRSNVMPGITDDVIISNRIGTNAAGAGAIGNQADGIFVSNISQLGNEIGDNADPDRNLISGNVGNGINLSASSNIQIQDNRIGSEADGTTSLGNQLDGVHLENSTSNLIYRNLIQGSGHVGVRIVDSSDNTVQAGNIGGSHSDGVLIVQSAGTASGNTIETTIGEGFTGLSLPNGGNGVDIVGASNNEINSNLLNNRLAGLEINGSTAVGNDFDGGLAYNNGKLGISIGDNIGTDHPNHQVNTGGGAGGGGPMLPDDGLNHPLITSASFDGTHTTISGTYLGDGNSQVSVEVYESNGADPSGFGEGERSVDSEDVTVPSDGNASFTLDGEEPPLYGANTVYSAIVERGTGSGGTDISEFSNAVKVVGASISGSVFNDVNGNGKQDPGEKGLAKQLVFVDRKGTGVFDDDIDPSAKTNSNGNFTLFGPPSGAIHLVTAVPSGFTQTLPNPKKPFYKINVAPLQHISGIIFGEEKAVAHIATIANPFNSTDSLDSKKRILDSLLSLI